MKTVVAIWALLAAALLIPVDLAYQSLATPGARWSNLLFSLGLICLLLAAAAMLRWRSGILLVAMVSVTLIAIRAAYFGLVQFSGAGFTAEVFLHLERESMVIALRDHSHVVVPLVLLISIGGLAALVAVTRLRSVGGRAAATLAAVGLLAASVSGTAAPEWQLLRAWNDWRRPLTAEVPPGMLTNWRQSGLIETEIVPKHRLKASGGASPKNLILVYLESVGNSIFEHPRWPDLMPNLARMQRSHGWVDHLQASGFITIEGLANSMCGTLLPFDRGSDALAGGNRQFRQLPCLGDVLAAAGYTQVYLGGAISSFAGKGTFLEAHGFDEVKGWEHWQAEGFVQRENVWGLSDVELLEQATAELQRLHEQDLPFNLTLLTIGTHLPGFPYEECRPYPLASDRFLDALHCTDQLLGGWVEQLQAEGLLQDSLLVVTSDHHVFASPGMRSLFGDAVEDRRLPLIVLGDWTLPEPAVRHGAGYDLAPTVLDLLGIEHNATFVLGRSLIEPSTRPDVQLSRYLDVLDGQVIDNNPARCPAPQTMSAELPFDACQKRILMSALSAIVERFARTPAQVSCTATRPTLVRGPEHPGEAVEWVIGGRDQGDMFSRFGHPIEPTAAGLYLMAFDRAGRSRGTHFWSPDDLATFDPLTYAEHARLLLWNPGAEPFDPELWPQWVASIGLLPGAPGIVLLDAEGAPRVSAAGRAELQLDALQCRELFGIDGG
jgi:hypothetical protein